MSTKINENEILNHLKLHFFYDKENGKIFYTKNRFKSCNKKPGTEAGFILRGYRRIEIKNKSYPIHRLIWLIEKGEFPKKEIDHINGIKDDNRIENLRDVDRRTNVGNMVFHRNGHLVGTSFDKRNKKWISYIHYNYKKIHLGVFKTKEEAHLKYME